MFKKALLSPSQPRLAETRLSTGKAAHCLLHPVGCHPCLAHGAYTAVREHDKGPSTQLACLPKPWRRLADFFNILLVFKGCKGFSMSLLQLQLRCFPSVLILWWVVELTVSLQARAMDLGVRCQDSPDSVFQAVKETALALPQWRSLRVMEEKRAVKAMVLNWRNFAVPVVIQVRPLSENEPHSGSQIHFLWEQTMDPVNYPDVIPFIEIFRQQQEDRGLNCIDIGTDVGL